MPGKTLKVVGALSLVAVLGAAAAWRLWGGDGPCLMFGTSHTLIKSLEIDGWTYHLYRSDSGSHDKARSISLASQPLPDVVCDYTRLKTLVYSTDIDTGRTLAKLHIVRRLNGFFLEPRYSGAAPGATPQDLAQLPIEIGNGK